MHSGSFSNLCAVQADIFGVRIVLVFAWMKFLKDCMHIFNVGINFVAVLSTPYALS